MSKTYFCTECKNEFETNAERDNHFRTQCKHTHNLIDGEENTLKVERIEGKFQCPSCQIKFTFTTNLTRHWKQCIKRDKTESNTMIISEANHLVSVDKEDELMNSLRYDGTYNLAVCVKCEFALPMEWVRKHFNDHHKITVINYINYV